MTEKKIRKYLESHGAYGFIAASHSTTFPFCIFCEKTFSNSIMKLGTLKKHFMTVHLDMEDLSLEKRAELINNFKTRNTILKFFETDAKVNEDFLKTSFEISLLIAKKGKPHTIAKNSHSTRYFFFFTERFKNER
ncbi:SCAN domain-containing protein 3 [Dictyocoela muelleri]|nr:SCAN domain-containing protein 3 [Dictyocoela muelleri]